MWGLTTWLLFIKSACRAEAKTTAPPAKMGAAADAEVEGFQRKKPIR
jgi:hypothetical protein